MRLAGVVGAVALTLVGTTVLYAGDTAGCKPNCRMENQAPHGEKFFKTLNLTKEQKVQIKQLHEENMGATKVLFDQMKVLRDESRKELLKPSPSQEVLNANAAKFGDLHKQLAEKRHAHLLLVKKILTPEQFGKLLEHEPPFPGMRGGKCGKRGMPPS